ncbi:MAG: (2,3-dihydroxybenzoyl)adenylate synthase [Micromonosporaceae bacterium]
MMDGVVPWPDDIAAEYAAAGYWRGRPLGDHLWDWADQYADRVAVVDGELRLTYRELAERADLLAERLLEIGLKPGETILTQLPNGWEFVAYTLACFRIGVAPVMALLPHRRHELSHLARHAGAAAIAVPGTWRDFDHLGMARQVAAQAPTVRELLVLGGGEDAHDLRKLLTAEADPSLAADRRKRLDALAPAASDPALFLLSGGTTGLPKLITRTHNDYEYNARCSGEVCQFDADTVYLVVLPAAHNFPLGCPGILGTLRVGGRVVLLPSPHPETALATIAAARVTVTAAVPAVAQKWLDTVAADPDRYDLSSLRTLQVGGARLAPEVAKTVTPLLGCRLQQVFGMAEGLLNYTRHYDPEDAVIHTQGRPISPADEIRIVDEAGDPVPVGEAGELLTRGPYTPRGYFRAPEHNATSFTEDGWYRTGDIVRLHASGNLMVEGRSKDQINVAGEKISAEEVENVIYTLPQVARVAAVAMPDRDAGERVCACVVLHPGGSLTLDEIAAAFVAGEVAKFKIPYRLELLDSLPLTNVGKVNKKALREYVASKLTT